MLETSYGYARQTYRRIINFTGNLYERFFNDRITYLQLTTRLCLIYEPYNGIHRKILCMPKFFLTTSSYFSILLTYAKHTCYLFDIHQHICSSSFSYNSLRWLKHQGATAKSLSNMFSGMSK